MTQKSKKSESLANEVFLTSPDFYHAPIKFAYMDKRPQSSYATRPSTKFSSNSNGTSTALGPGRYSISTKPISQSFHFSKSDRFDSSDFFSKFSQFKKITPSQKEKINERIEKNNKLAGLSKEQKLKILQKNAEKEKIRSEVAQMTRKKLNYIKIIRKSEKTKEKFRKFEYRMKLSVRVIQEIAEIKKFWLVFGSVFTAITSLKYLIILKKNLKKRANRNLRIFQYTSKFIGKLYRIHIKHKYYKGLRIIRIYLTKYVKLWQKQRYRRNRRIILNAIESKLGSLILIRLVKAWTNKFETVKRIMRSALFYKVSLFQSLIHRWNTCEYEIRGGSPQNTVRYRKALSIHSISDDKGLEGCLNIPNEIKIEYMKRYIKERILDYLKEYKIFRTHFKSVHRQNIKNRWLLENDIIVEYPIAPDKVNMYNELTLDKVKIIVEKALSEKSTWRNIIFRNRRL